MSESNEQLESLFENAVALSTPAERSDYLIRACPDLELRRELESLLAFHQNPDPIFDDTVCVKSVAPRARTHEEFVGQILDEKYRLERLLGQGGMGAVYLSTHLGTGRYVALKLITPQFMRNQEFVERFKREARAAGRLRHPNIVDVTDFGVARVGEESVAYLVMEYLDGCTLSDVLAEEKRLPLPWIVDILEQVCSAVHEAHQQGVIHRDLKPANIWLEPNTLGGYRVKVLDFGIAKLAETNELPCGAAAASPNVQDQPMVSAGAVAVHPATPSTTNLTQAGAILGTPSFMSPEQCRGDALDARSDVYSLGIIAYQMIAGMPPFTGEAAFLLRAHQQTQPAPLTEHERRVPRGVSRLIMSTLEKNPAQRPQTALAFARVLRAHTDGVGALYRRAFALYCEYFPTVLKLSLLAHIPVAVVTLITIGAALAQAHLGKASSISLEIFTGLLKGGASFVTGSTIAGVIAILVTQLAVAPLKPIALSSAFAILQRRRHAFFRTGLLATLRIILGVILLVVPGMVLAVRYSLWAPVVLMEGLEKKSALKRSETLAARSWRTSILAIFFQFFFPGLVHSSIWRLISQRASGMQGLEKTVVSELIGLSSIVFLPLVSIVIALVYLKMRQIGGEALGQVMAPIEEQGTRTKWEERMRDRLTRLTPP